MRAISLMYHDVVDLAAHELSGFAGADAATYKITASQFEAHLQAITCAIKEAPVLATQIARTDDGISLLLTFDDGGVSAISDIADRLETLNWRGHFFVTAGQIGKPSFLGNSQILELHNRGHLVGSHSFTHPLRMATLPDHKLKYEWDSSIEKLSVIVGEQVTTASIPGGQYSRKIVQAASAAGITKLFTSEPVSTCREVEGCELFGRYAIRSWTTPAQAAALAQGSVAPRLKQLFTWNARKVAKTLGGNGYLKFRDLLLRHV